MFLTFKRNVMQENNYLNAPKAFIAIGIYSTS